MSSSWLNQLRVVKKNNRYLIVLKDICTLLQISNVTQAFRQVPEVWRDMTNINTVKGLQEVLVVSVDGLLKLVARSNLPESINYQKFICKAGFIDLLKKRYVELHGH